MGERLLKRCVGLLVAFVFCATAWGAQDRIEDRVRVRAKDWTVLIFLNGHNNLDQAGFDDLNEMEKVGSNENVNLVVQWASIKNDVTKRLLVKRDADPKNVRSPIVETLPAVDMGDWNSLVEFVRWGVGHYPTRHYFIDVWNHGGGWQRLARRLMAQSDGEAAIKDISWDDRTGHHITTEQLGEALRRSASIIGHKIDIYGSDACLMGMFEVASEMADAVDVFVGSEDLEPGPGWPYDMWLKRWATAKNAAARDIAASLVEEYAKSYMGGSQGTGDGTLSAIDLKGLDRMNAAIAKLGAAIKMLGLDDRARVASALESSMHFYLWDNVDFMSFVQGLKASNIAFVDQSIFSEIDEAYAGTLIANKTTPRFDGATGMAIWFPTYFSASAMERYKALRFNKGTDWASTLEMLWALHLHARQDLRVRQP